MKHIYVHVPFCTRRCIYCDFSIAVRREIPANRYVSSIIREYEHRKARGEWDSEPLSTLYLGGGTPSLMPAAYLSQLVGFLVEAETVLGSGAEVTIEANPEDVTASNASAWVRAGVNRVSLGVQSFDSNVLRWMHRNHRAKHVVDSVRILRSAGIGSISIDLIAALPDELHHNFSRDLEQALDLEPEHMSVYGLTAEPRTALARWIARGSVVPATDEEYARDYTLAHDLLASAGYEHYEVSNYALVGHRSRHNHAYWDGSRYAGLGPSAHGFDGAVRRWNVAPWALYERRIADSGDATESWEHLTPEQLELERVYLRLRVAEGLDIREAERFEQAIVAKAEQHGWAEASHGRWRLTPSGWLRMDLLVGVLTTSPEGG